ncbi:hypothetical protein NQZ68_027182 [Dissostichus eleginoides]|nr:hypothetical protein NQZ68_027182 [Dissostichus eleginoides]
MGQEQLSHDSMTRGLAMSDYRYIDALLQTEISQQQAMLTFLREQNASCTAGVRDLIQDLIQDSRSIVIPFLPLDFSGDKFGSGPGVF